MKVIFGYVFSRNSDEEIPIYQEMTEEDYKVACERLESNFCNILKDYVFNQLKKSEVENGIRKN